MLGDYAIASSGLTVQLARHEVLANNVANGSTTGFLRDTVVVETGATRPGTGGLPQARVAGVVTQAATGGLRPTGNPLDLALRGDGYFQVETPDGPRLSRAGSFTLDGGGTLRDVSGRALLGEGGPIITAASRIEVRASGEIVGDGEVIDTISLRAVAPGAPIQKTKEGLLWPARGEGDLVNAEATEVVQGYLENSAVNPVREMVDMIAAFRAYEAGVRSLQALDSVLGQATERIGRLSVAA